MNDEGGSSAFVVIAVIAVLQLTFGVYGLQELFGLALWQAIGVLVAAIFILPRFLDGVFGLATLILPIYGILKYFEVL